MIVAGGHYLEKCAWPEFNEGFGSGGRAALALALAGVKVQWHYYCPIDQQDSVAYILGNKNITHCPVESEDLVTFEYYHSLSRPVFSPGNLSLQQPIELRGDVILRFGFMEGDAKVIGEKVVYDPQSPGKPVPFRANHSEAKDLAIVLNRSEVRILGESDDESVAIRRIGETDRARIVIVKAGVQGCRVYENGKLLDTIPPYKSDSVYKVGSGDVFSAAFAYHWAIEGIAVADAADAASRCTARYCGSKHLPSAALDSDTDALVPAGQNQHGQVYVAGPFFTIAERWLIEEACRAFNDLGVRFFSPYHEVGLGSPEEVVQPDLEGLEECTAVFAVLDGCDPGTVFEIGYAVKKEIPVVALSQNTKKGHQTMLLGSKNCIVLDDFATAIYHAAWECWR